MVKARDEKRIELARAAFDWKPDTRYEVTVAVEGSTIKTSIGCGPSLEATDDDYPAGGIGLAVADGAVSANQFDVAPLK